MALPRAPASASPGDHGRSRELRGAQGSSWEITPLPAPHQQRGGGRLCSGGERRQAILWRRQVALERMDGRADRPDGRPWKVRWRGLVEGRGRFEDDRADGPVRQVGVEERRQRRFCGLSPAVRFGGDQGDRWRSEEMGEIMAPPFLPSCEIRWRSGEIGGDQVAIRGDHGPAGSPQLCGGDPRSPDRSARSNQKQSEAIRSNQKPSDRSVSVRRAGSQAARQPGSRAASEARGHGLKATHTHTPLPQPSARLPSGGERECLEPRRA